MQNTKGILVVILAVIMAIWLGASLVTDQLMTMAKFLGVGGLVICALMGRKIWLVMIFLSALSFPLIRGFSTSELGHALFVGFTFLILLMRRQPLKLSFGWAEFWMLATAATVVQAYLRNPVGLNLFGAGAVGAKPYFIAGVTFCSAALLSLISVSPADLRWAFRLSVIGTALSYPLDALRSTGGVAATTIGVAEAESAGEGSGRVAVFGGLGRFLAKLVGSYISPLRACFHPFWIFVVLAAFGFAALSGYRNHIAYVGLMFLAGIAYRGGGISLVISVLGAVLGLTLLAFVNLVAPLPPNIQRALSPFPGTWEERHVQAAEQSTEWRIEMWKEALFTEHWIENKLLGDGLGFTRRELMMIMDVNEGRYVGTSGSDLNAQQETMMITGNYHSGPVQTVRATGYFGLVLLLGAMIYAAVLAHRLILRCRGTDWYIIALYFGLGSIVRPFMFTFVFGTFEQDFAGTILSIGIVQLFHKNLPPEIAPAALHASTLQANHPAWTRIPQGPLGSPCRR